MRKSRFTDEGEPWPQGGRASPDEQIIGMIKEQEAGMATAEACRRHGLSLATFYKPRASIAAWTCPMPRG